MEVALGMHCALGQASARFGRHHQPLSSLSRGLASGQLVKARVEPANLLHQRVFGFFDMPPQERP